jgi:MFS family permease
VRDGRSKRFRIVAPLALATLTYAVSQTLLLPSLPRIQASLHTTPVGVTSLFSAFFVAGAVSGGIFGRLGDMFGKRLMLVVQMALFAVGSLVCALGSNLPQLIAGRVLMGVAVGVFPISYALIKDELPAASVRTLVPMLGGIGASGAAIGQVSGGLVADRLGYHWVFWIALIGAALSIAAIARFVPESSVRTAGRVDVVGAVLLACGLGGALYAISRASTWVWGSGRTLSLLLGGVLVLVVFFAYERAHPDPLFHLETLMLPRVRATNLATLLVGFGLFGASTIITQFVQVPKSTGYGLGASPTQAGFFLAPGLLLILLEAPLAGRLSARVGAKAILVGGLAIAVVALTGLAAFHTRTFELYLWPTLIYAGLGFTFATMPLIVLDAVPAERSAQSTSINMVLRNAGSSIGVQLAATLITASIVVSGHPTDAGYTHAFTLEAAASFAAFLLALAIPASKARRGRGERGGAVEVVPVPDSV